MDVSEACCDVQMRFWYFNELATVANISFKLGDVLRVNLDLYCKSRAVFMSAIDLPRNASGVGRSGLCILL